MRIRLRTNNTTGRLLKDFWTDWEDGGRTSRVQRSFDRVRYNTKRDAEEYEGIIADFESPGANEKFLYSVGMHLCVVPRCSVYYPPGECKKYRTIRTTE
jgi:hypothetical protein